MAGDGTNGDEHGANEGQRIAIVFTRNPYIVQLLAPGVELHMTIAVLRTALDELEAQLRLARVAQMQQAAADQELSRRIFQKH